MKKCIAGGLAVLCLGFSVPLMAGGVPIELDPVTVIGVPDLQDESRSATEGYVTAEQLSERPISRAGELLEFVPGLMVTQHSGEGKANQYFLRGFNLDHGTDFYSDVDGLPVNMRTHAHGQGYADINFIIPELIGSLEYRKGPYSADVGDFAAAGSANLRYVDSLPQNIAKVTIGEYGYQSALLAASPSLLGGTLLLGAQATHYDGPFDLEENVRKYATIARFNKGNDQQGFTASLMSYDIQYTAPDQIPQRAVDSGEIDRLGYIDPSDGGSVGRYSANLEFRGLADGGNWRAQAYALKYRMQLYSNFTYFLTDSEHGDQFNQFDDRKVYGVNARRYWLLPTTIPIDVTLGLQSRYDDIDPVGLYLTQARQRLSTVREDRVKEGSVGLYLSSTQKWLPWLRSQIGARADRYFFDVDSRDQTRGQPLNSGSDQDSIYSPKVALIFGPWDRTQFYLNYGQGFHSNDARGVTTTVDPLDATVPQNKVDPLVKARGSEIGVSSGIVPHLTLAASLWQLDFDSELVYVGDAGANEPSGSSRRRGLELSASYQLFPWLLLDADYAYAHSRLDSEDGDRIPNSIGSIYGLGVTVPETRGWSGGLRLRHLGPGPLVEDDSARSKSTTVLNGQVGYRFLQRYTSNLQILNLLNSHDHDITYYYESRLPGEPAEGAADFHFHPVEPRSVRVTVGAEF
ncbi:MAG: TonB-dependent receptor [Hydrocarboniphaga sp.]|uniref:TonB-dependent receptor n=1 Tax=Hydrocarboniphaga sp. TaxID=2033016 RepID=UPI00263343AD|nr:TonB-dependent receptor [Hydrocarboniphaga sp.]MDB5970418.1 TonB-dependent receptor [Hydrocarboniphaga sp.]